VKQHVGPVDGLCIAGSRSGHQGHVFDQSAVPVFLEQVLDVGHVLGVEMSPNFGLSSPECSKKWPPRPLDALSGLYGHETCGAGSDVCANEWCHFGDHLAFLLLRGALFGLVAYATYDLTNLATVKDSPLIVTVVTIQGLGKALQSCRGQDCFPDHVHDGNDQEYSTDAEPGQSPPGSQEGICIRTVPFA
jgi:hypothetical protein